MLTWLVSMGAGLILGSNVVRAYYNLKRGESAPEWGISWIGLAIALWGIAF